jgi:hypothetical protein
VAEVRARVEKDSVQISVKAHGDADVDLWAASRKVELFEKVFGREVFFSTIGKSTAKSERAARGNGQPRATPSASRKSSTKGKSGGTTRRKRPARTKRSRPR